MRYAVADDRCGSFVFPLYSIVTPSGSLEYRGCSMSLLPKELVLWG